MASSHLRSPPRPSPGGLHYSDEDICNKYNGAVLTESVNLKEKSVDGSESEVSTMPASNPCSMSLLIPHLISFRSRSHRGMGRADGGVSIVEEGSHRSEWLHSFS